MSWNRSYKGRSEYDQELYLIPRICRGYSREHHDGKRPRGVELLGQHGEWRREDDEGNEEDADNQVVLSLFEVQVLGEACCLRVAEVALVESVEEVYCASCQGIDCSWVDVTQELVVLHMTANTGMSRMSNFQHRLFSAAWSTTCALPSTTPAGW